MAGGYCFRPSPGRYDLEVVRGVWAPAKDVTALRSHDTDSSKMRSMDSLANFRGPEIIAFLASLAGGEAFVTGAVLVCACTT